MDKFTASNGVEVKRRRNEVMFSDDSSILAPEEQALREFFQAERDEELGRWRWPENPDYVVYRFASRNVRVLRESIGKSLEYMDEGAWPSNPSDYSAAARAYFEAHPESKPWDDAVAGEIWALTLDDGVEHDVFIHEDRITGGRDGVSAGGAYFDIDDGAGITSARRIWPESD